jgi:hypothetical protein
MAEQAATGLPRTALRAIIGTRCPRRRQEGGDMSQSAIEGLLPLLTPLILAAGLASPVQAQVLITQAKALAGGVTPGDAPGFPVTLSRRGSYRLTSNLTPPGRANAIEVRSPDVTVDLNGFSVIGTFDNTANGIYAWPGGDGDSLTVLNGTIAGFIYGIWAGQFAVVDNVRLVKNVIGAALSRGARVTRSTIVENDDSVTVGCGSLIEHSTFYGNVDGPGFVGGCDGGQGDTVRLVGNVIRNR